MKKSFLITCVALNTCTILAQTTENKDNSKLKFGFNFGTNYSLLNTKKELPSNTAIYNGFGTKLGLMMDYSITPSLLFSPKIEMAFNKSGAVTTNSDNTRSTYKVFETTIEMMTHLVYKIGDKKTLPYLLLGPNFRMPLEKKSNSSSSFNNKSDLAIDFGLGLENKLKNFTLAPEIRYSLGLLNVNKNPALQELNYHNISLVLNFK
jgi:hypothetical protein